MKQSQPRRQRVTSGTKTMKPELLKDRIERLQHALRVLRDLQYEDPTAGMASTIEQVESKLRQVCHEAGWHCVSLIENGTATDVVFEGPHDHCTEYVSIWLEAHPEDKGKFIITPY